MQHERRVQIPIMPIKGVRFLPFHSPGRYRRVDIDIRRALWRGHAWPHTYFGLYTRATGEATYCIDVMVCVG